MGVTLSAEGPLGKAASLGSWRYLQPAWCLVSGTSTVSRGAPGSLRLKGGLGSSTFRCWVSGKALLPPTHLLSISCLLPSTSVHSATMVTYKFPLGRNRLGLYGHWRPTLWSHLEAPAPFLLPLTLGLVRSTTLFSQKLSKSPNPKPLSFFLSGFHFLNVDLFKGYGPGLFFLFYQTKLCAYHSLTPCLGFF